MFIKMNSEDLQHRIEVLTYLCKCQIQMLRINNYFQNCSFITFKKIMKNEKKNHRKKTNWKLIYWTGVVFRKL